MKHTLNPARVTAMVITPGWLIKDIWLTWNKEPETSNIRLEHLSTYLPQMKITNVEIKARCADPARIRQILEDAGARFAGRDHQIDTYFNTHHGRLKLREGNVENALIAYARKDHQGPKRSDVVLYKTSAGAVLKDALTTALGVRIVVDKQRDIFFLDDVKFHVDEVRGLGTFVEIEVIDDTGKVPESTLRARCENFIAILGIGERELITHSYSDLLESPQ